MRSCPELWREGFKNAKTDHQAFALFEYRAKLIGGPAGYLETLNEAEALRLGLLVGVLLINHLHGFRQAAVEVV